MIEQTKTTTKKKVTTVNVVTFDGTTHPRSKCRKISNEFYLIGDVQVKDSGQCFLINDTYYTLRPSSAKIAWDHTRKQYNLIDQMVQGYVDNKLTFGYFTLSLTECLQASRDLYFMNETCIPKNYSYDFGSGIYTDAPVIKKMSITERKPIRKMLRTDLYGFGEDPSTQKVLETSFNWIQNNVDRSVLDKYFKDYKYGLEVETDGGWLPERTFFRYGALPLRDGSIFGEEVTTAPYTGPRVFNTIRGLFKEMQKFNMSSQNNSLHVNVGNVPNTPEFRVALWVLYCRLQAEVEAMIPAYKRDQRYFLEKRGRGKDHCRYMESLGLLKRYTNLKTEIPEADDIIRRFLNEGSTSKEFKAQNQPKWEQKTRYYSLNFLPLYFEQNAKRHRIEYRIHSGTVNPTKALNWILICTAITHYAQTMQNTIFEGKVKITLSDVIDHAFQDGEEGTELANYLKAYVQQRTREHIATIEQDNLYGTEFLNDNGYKFIFGGFDIESFGR